VIFALELCHVSLNCFKLPQLENKAPTSDPFVCSPSSSCSARASEQLKQLSGCLPTSGELKINCTADQFWSLVWDPWTCSWDWTLGFFLRASEAHPVTLQRLVFQASWSSCSLFKPGRNTVVNVTKTWKITQKWERNYVVMLVYACCAFCAASSEAPALVSGILLSSDTWARHAWNVM